MILNSEKIGNGEKQLVILHGLYGSRESWLRVANILSSDFTIYLLDQRNHGESFHNPSHTYNDLAEDLKNWADFNNLQQFYLIGHSMGGKTAMYFADKYPQMLKKIVIADISPSAYTALLNNVESTNFHINLISLMNLMPIEDFSSYREASTYLKEYDENVKNIILKNLKKIDKKLVWKLNIKAISNNFPEIMSGLNPDDYIDKKIDVPTLFLKAGNSEYITKNDEKLIRFIFSNVELKVIEDAGHWLHFEQPYRVATSIKEFLA